MSNYIQDFYNKIHKSNQDETKTFLVFNTACFGDNLVCNALCQNIKKIYPDSKVVFIVNRPFLEVAKYQKDVDDVVIYDKKGEHKGLKGFFKFLKNFKYKNSYAAFITYRNVRNVFVAALSGAKHIYEGKKLNNKKTAQEQILLLLGKLTKEPLLNLPIEYNADSSIPEHLIGILSKDDNYIGLSCLTKKTTKDIPIDTTVELIKKFNIAGEYKILLLGTGDNNQEYADKLQQAGCEFINLVNKTSIYELAQVLKNCKALISADTGTMHFGYALKIPTLAIFYERETLPTWSPDPNLYNTITLSSFQTAENIYSSCQILIGNEKEKKLSVVIPTLQKNTDLLINLLKILEQDNAVDEIILIDNSRKGLSYTNNKLKIIIPEKNLFVNPSWNYGTKFAKNNIVALLNDDIMIAPKFCSNVINKMDYKMGCVGACAECLLETENIVYNVEDSIDMKLTPIDLITYHWGVAIFYYKSSFRQIPDEIKIFRGDDWLFYENKSTSRQNYYIEGQKIYHYGSLTSRSKALKPIGRRDRYYYRKYTKKWYQHYFDYEKLSDGYRLTIFGCKIIVK